MRSVALRRAVFFLTWHVPGCKAARVFHPVGRVVFFLGTWLVQPWIFLFEKETTSWIIRKWKSWPRNDLKSMFSFECPMIWYRMIPTCFKKRMLCKKSLSLSQSPSRDSFHQKYGSFVQHRSPSPNSEYQKWDVLGPKPSNSEKDTILQEGALVYKPSLATFHCFFLCLGQDPRDVSCFILTIMVPSKSLRMPARPPVRLEVTLRSGWTKHYSMTDQGRM